MHLDRADGVASGLAVALAEALLEEDPALVLGLPILAATVVVFKKIQAPVAVTTTPHPWTAAIAPKGNGTSAVGAQRGYGGRRVLGGGHGVTYLAQSPWLVGSGDKRATDA